MRNGANAFVMLGRDPFLSAGGADEEDFRAWVAFVSRYIDSASGLKTHVDTRGVDSPAQHNILVTLDAAAEPYLHEALSSLWSSWEALGRPRQFLEDIDDDDDTPTLPGGTRSHAV